MIQPIWNTPLGSIGTYASGATVNFQLSATSMSTAFNMRYFLQSGSLPPGLSLDTITGKITGTMGVYSTAQTSTFTIRAIDGNGHLRDRTFTATVSADLPPNFTTPTGILITTLDSTWIYEQVPYTTSLSDKNVDIVVTKGIFPSGLQIDSNGIIHGYCNIVNIPTSYNFTLRISNSIGSNTRDYVIVVNPTVLYVATNQRLPTILNNQPLFTPIPTTDEYYGYYRADDISQFTGSTATTPGVATLEGSVGTTVGYGSGSYTQTGTTLSIAKSDGWVQPGTQIMEQLTGTPGGIGTYKLDTTQTVSTTNIYATGNLGGHTTFTGSITGDTLTVTAILAGTVDPGLLLSTYRPVFVGDTVTDGVVSATIAAAGTGQERGQFTLDQTVTFTGPITISSDKLVINSFNSGQSLVRGDIPTGSTLVVNTYITDQWSGTPGGLGVYVLDQQQVSAYDILTINRTVLTVTNITSGAITLGQPLQTTTGTGIALNTRVVEQLTPLLTGETLGGLGRYVISSAQTLAPTTLIMGIDIGTYYYDDFFSYKVIGHDFSNLSLTYQFLPATTPLPNGQLPLPGGPAGLTMDPATGWITGVPTSSTPQRYSFTVTATNSLSGVSESVTFSVAFSNVYSSVVNWTTPTFLGTITNYHPSRLSINAISEDGSTLQYKIINGSLPSGLELLPSGLIIGRPSFTDRTVIPGSTTTYSFTVQASSVDGTSIRIFTVNVLNKYSVPVETVYLKCTPPVHDRRKLIGESDSLFHPDVIDPDLLYRAEDPYFGANEQIRIDHIYGVNANLAQAYIDAVTQRHYKRQFTLGELKTAVARDDTGAIIYEVVYCSLIDNLYNPQDVSINYQITWPTQIPIPTIVRYFDSRGDIYTAWDYVLDKNYYTSLIWEYLQVVYPNSLQNMETTLVSELGRQADTTLMPAWMTSQQIDGGTTGYVPAWVICYTKPGASETVRQSILEKWPYTMNLIDFGVDRVYVDKNMTFNYTPTASWTSLPPGVIQPINIINTVAPNIIISNSPVTGWHVDLAFTITSSTGTAVGGLELNTVYYVKDVDNTVTPARITISKRLDKFTEVLTTAGLMGEVLTATPIHKAPWPTDSKDYMILYDNVTIIY